MLCVSDSLSDPGAKLAYVSVLCWPSSRLHADLQVAEAVLCAAEA